MLKTKNKKIFTIFCLLVLLSSFLNAFVPNKTFAQQTQTPIEKEFSGEFELKAIPSNDKYPYLILIKKGQDYPSSDRFFYFIGDPKNKNPNPKIYKYGFQYSWGVVGPDGKYYHPYLFVKEDMPFEGDLYFQPVGSVQSNNYIQFNPKKISFSHTRDVPFNLKTEKFLTIKPPTGSFGIPLPKTYTIEGKVTFTWKYANDVALTVSTSSIPLYLYKVKPDGSFSLERKHSICAAGISTGQSYSCGYRIENVPEGTYVLIVQDTCTYGKSKEFKVDDNKTIDFDAINYGSTIQCALAQIIEIVKETLLTLFNWGKNIIESVIYIPSEQLNADFITKIHDTIKNICYLLFVLGFLIIILANLLRIDLGNYAIKVMLPRLLTAMILVAFSLTITRIILDIGNVLTKQAILLPQNINQIYYSNHITDNLSLYKPTLPSVSNSLSTIGGVTLGAGITGLVGLSYVSGLFNILALAGLGGFGVGFIIFIIVVLLFPLAALLTLAALLMLRVFAIWLLAILSPLAFLFMVLPFTRGLYSRWWSELSRWVFMGPMVALFLGISESTISLMGEPASIYSKIAKNIGDIGWLIPIFGIVTLLAAVAVPTMLAGQVYGAFQRLGRRISGGFSALTGGRLQSLTRLGEQVREDRRLANIAQGRGVYRFMNKSARAELGREALQREAARYQINNAGRSLADIQQDASRGNIGAQAYLALRGEDFPGAAAAIKRNPALAEMYRQSRPDLVYTDRNNRPDINAIRNALDNNEIDITKFDSAAIRNLSSAGFNFTAAEINAIYSKGTPGQKAALATHFVNNVNQFTSLQDRDLQKQIIKTVINYLPKNPQDPNDKIFQDFLQGVGPTTLKNAFNSFTKSDVKELNDYDRGQKAAQFSKTTDYLNSIGVPQHFGKPF